MTVTTYGITSVGLVRKPADIIKQEIEAKLLARLKRKLNLDARSANGQYVGISTGSYDDLWQLLELVYASMRPSSATGQALADLCAITGTIKKLAHPLTTTFTLVGVNGTVVPAGSTVTNESGLVRADTDSDATIATLSLWVTAHAYLKGDLVSSGGNVYVALVDGTSSIAPTGTPAYPSFYLDSTGLSWGYLGAGLAAIQVTGTGQESGPISGPAFSLNTIGSPIAGWTSVANVLDAQPGEADETDANLRIRRVIELHGLSTGPLESILAALIDTDGVRESTVFENTDGVPNADGMPGNSVEAVVVGGTDDDIRATLFANVPAGIQTYGNTSGTVTDSRGRARTIMFTRPVDINVYLLIAVYGDLTKFPADYKNQIKQQIITYGAANLVEGFDVEPWAIGASVSLKSLYRVEVYADIAPISFSTVLNQPISVGPREKGSLDASRIEVNGFQKTP